MHTNKISFDVVREPLVNNKVRKKSFRSSIPSSFDLFGGGHHWSDLQKGSAKHFVNKQAKIPLGAQTLYTVPWTLMWVKITRRPCDAGNWLRLLTTDKWHQLSVIFLSIFVIKLYNPINPISSSFFGISLKIWN